MTTASQTARIITDTSEGGRGGPATKTQGTKVLLGDGSELSHVTGITLTAGLKDVWRARIECVVKPPASVVCEAEIVVTDGADVQAVINPRFDQVLWDMAMDEDYAGIYLEIAKRLRG